PTLWQEFRALLPACPGNVLRRQWADRPAQEFRWGPQLAYQGSGGRGWGVNALGGEGEGGGGAGGGLGRGEGRPGGAQTGGGRGAGGWRRGHRRGGGIAGRWRTRGSTARRTAA